MSLLFSQLVKGRLYTVIGTEGGVFNGRYMGEDIYGRLQFDVRPDYGTTTISKMDVKEIRQTLGTLD